MFLIDQLVQVEFTVRHSYEQFFSHIIINFSWKEKGIIGYESRIIYFFLKKRRNKINSIQLIYKLFYTLIVLKGFIYFKLKIIFLLIATDLGMLILSFNF